MHTHRPLWIALTGGIASGKSAVANEFARLGVPIVDLDILARQVVAPGQRALTAIIERFGNAVLKDDGNLDRARLRELVFNDVSQKQALENILHPAIRNAQLAQSAKLNGPYQIHVVPLLVETPSQNRYDRILVVTCHRDTQMQRLLQRDGIQPTLAEQMLNAQVDSTQRLKYADDVIENDGSPSELPAKVAALHRQYLHLAGRPTIETPA